MSDREETARKVARGLQALAAHGAEKGMHLHPGVIGTEANIAEVTATGEQMTLVCGDYKPEDVPFEIEEGTCDDGCGAHIVWAKFASVASRKICLDCFTQRAEGGNA